MFSKMKARYKELLDESKKSDDLWQTQEVSFKESTQEMIKITSIGANYALYILKKIKSKRAKNHREIEVFRPSWDKSIFDQHHIFEDD